MLTLLTTTGARPIPFSLCQRWMEAQDYVGEVLWIVVDDGPSPQPIVFEKEGWTIQVVRPTPYWQEGENTQARNLIAGLELIPSTANLVIIEDDDYYSPSYLSSVALWLKKSSLVGECNSRYFNVETDHFRYCRNMNHASLCSTAMEGDALELFREVVAEPHKFIDLELWKQFRGKKKVFDTSLTCGIKGLPGRGGIGIGHRLEGRRDRRMLAKWIGADARWYGKG